MTTIDTIIEQFDQWLAAAKAADEPEPTAMTLATADGNGIPSARVVLLKEFDRDGFVFYTHYLSRKARQMRANPRAALCFLWKSLERQVRIEGEIDYVDADQSDRYFLSRPRGSQLGAWASEQSRELASRGAFDERIRELEARFDVEPMVRPEFWGGFRLTPVRIEFWQGRRHRLHDRTEYRRIDNDRWSSRVLQP